MKPITTKHRMARILLGLILSAGFGIVGCGRPDREPAVAPAAPIAQAYPIATPTLSPLDKTQQAIDERMMQELQTAAARPTPATLPPLPTDLPTLTPLTGILTDCETSYFRNIIVYSNCWQNTLNGSFLFVVAGYDPENTNQGKIGFYTVAPNEYDPAAAFDFSTPTQRGTVTIIAAAPPRFTVTAADGTTFVFNVATRAWEPPPYPGP
jgi:hypothetical protein